MVSFKELSQQEADTYLLDSYCPELLKTKLSELPEITERNQLVTEVTENYFQQYDKMPVSRVLQMLADYLLLDHIKNTDVYKMNKVPILTDRQMGTRRTKEALLEEQTIDYFNTGNIWNFAKKNNTQEMELD